MQVHSEVVKNHLPNIHAYADDTQIYLSFKLDSTAGEQDPIAALQDCITDIRSWMIADRLKLNDGKDGIYDYWRTRSIR